MHLLRTAVIRVRDVAHPVLGCQPIDQDLHALAGPASFTSVLWDRQTRASLEPSQNSTLGQRQALCTGGAVAWMMQKRCKLGDFIDQLIQHVVASILHDTYMSS
jgi:hypothetical protein